MTDFVLVISAVSQMAFASVAPAAPPPAQPRPDSRHYPTLAACEAVARDLQVPPAQRPVCLPAEPAEANDTN